jgi:hypothetical protein
MVYFEGYGLRFIAREISRLATSSTGRFWGLGPILNSGEWRRHMYAMVQLPAGSGGALHRASQWEAEADRWRVDICGFADL